jgi:hypothetical protein
VLQEVLKTVTKITLKNGYRVMHAKWASAQYAAKQKGQEEGRED